MDTLILILGWVAFALGGAGISALITTSIALRLIKGELEALIPAAIIGLIAAIAWIVFAAWLSPITIGLDASVETEQHDITN